MYVLETTGEQVSEQLASQQNVFGGKHKVVFILFAHTTLSSRD